MLEDDDFIRFQKVELSRVYQIAHIIQAPSTMFFVWAAEQAEYSSCCVVFKVLEVIISHRKHRRLPLVSLNLFSLPLARTPTVFKDSSQDIAIILDPCAQLLRQTM